MNDKPNDVRVVRVELLERIESSLRVPDGCPPEIWKEVERTVNGYRAEVRAIIAQPAEQQGEPVAWQFQDRTGKWCGFMNERHYQNTLSDGTWPIRALYAQPATAKVDENAEFEIWRNEQCESLKRMGYPEAAKKFRELGSIHWAGWQARAKLNK